jgi:4'-phosphopantetheinyl transferase
MAASKVSTINLEVFSCNVAGALSPPSLTETNAHVWYRELPGTAATIADFDKTLSPDEKNRAGRYKFDRHRNDFIMCRGTLRCLLGSYLDLPPAQIEFEYSSYGKPKLAESHRSRNLKFNLSHTDGMAMFAFARDRDLGVDVEKVRSDVEIKMISRRFFAVEEQKAILALPEEHQYEAFFRCWTRKEAYIKGLGEGLSMPLDQFEVSINEIAMLLRNHRDAAEVSRWAMFDLNVGPPYAAALAITGAKNPDICS